MTEEKESPKNETKKEKVRLSLKKTDNRQRVKLMSKAMSLQSHYKLVQAEFDQSIMHNTGAFIAFKEAL